MKKIIYLLLFALLGASGCSKDESVIPEEDFTDEALATLGITAGTTRFSVSSAEQMEAFAYIVNKNSATYGSSKVTLSKDIDMKGVDWTPIGWFTDYSTDNSAIFKGTFDGGDYTISNLTIDSSLSTHVGLFGYIDGATIKDLTLTDVSISASKSEYVGAITGYMSGNTTIENCHVSDAKIVGSNYVGGIAGYAYETNTSKSINITYCSSTKGDISGSDYIGGIVGSSFRLNLTASWNDSTISGVTYIGGVAGSGSSSQYKGCYNQGAATATTDYVGGIIGLELYGLENLQSGVVSCYNSGTLSNSTGSFTGGIIGAVESAVTAAANYYKSTSSTAIGGYTTSTDDDDSGNGSDNNSDNTDPTGFNKYSDGDDIITPMNESLSETGVDEYEYYDDGSNPALQAV